jgi:hypothetical protein
MYLRDNKLVTCVVSPNKGTWEVMWVSDVKTPKDFKASGLNETVEQAMREIAAMYAGTAKAGEMELQLAIYPFSGKGSTVLDLTRDIDGFSVSDSTQTGVGVGLRAPTLEALVAEAAASADHEDWMFHWVIPMTELPSA